MEKTDTNILCHNFYKNSFSLEERIKIKHLVDKGLTWDEISAETGRPKDSIRNEVTRKGGRANYDPIQAQKTFEENLRKVINRPGTTYLTLEERKLIEKGCKESLKLEDIAKIVGRPRATIKNEIMKYGPREKYDAEIAHKIHSHNIISRASKNHIPITDEQLEIIKEGFGNNFAHEIIRTKAGIGRQRFKRWFELNKDLVEDWSKNTTTLVDRINALEAQMEIIIDLIKEKK